MVNKKRTHTRTIKNSGSSVMFQVLLSKVKTGQPRKPGPRFNRDLISIDVLGKADVMSEADASSH